MSVGEFRKRIIIQTPTRVSDSQGGAAQTWSTFATVWAKIEPRSASQGYKGQALYQDTTHVITVRQPPVLALTTAMRILYGARLFQIHGFINEGERNRFTVIQAEEGVPA